MITLTALAALACLATCIVAEPPTTEPANDANDASTRSASTNSATRAGGDPNAKPLAQGRDGDFFVALTMTTQVGFFGKWSMADLARVPGSDTFTRGKEINTVVLTAGACAAENGNADVRYHWQLIKPDGTESFSGDETLWTKAPFAAPRLMMADAFPAFSMDENDPSGRYLLKVHAKDYVADKQIELEFSFELAP